MTTQVGKILTIYAHTDPRFQTFTFDSLSTDKSWSYDDAPVTAGNFVVGVAYTIATVGTTDFTLIGAASNTVGVTFTAIANPPGTAAQYGVYPYVVGTGTGTATIAGITRMAQPLPAAGQTGFDYVSLYSPASLTGAPETPGSPFPTQNFIVEIQYLSGAGPDTTQTVDYFRGLALAASNSAFGLAMA